MKLRSKEQVCILGVVPKSSRFLRGKKREGMHTAPGNLGSRLGISSLTSNWNSKKNMYSSVNTRIDESFTKTNSPKRLNMQEILSFLLRSYWEFYVNYISALAGIPP